MTSDIFTKIKIIFHKKENRNIFNILLVPFSHFVKKNAKKVNY
ncbi:hypothetical protein BALOs_2097 [Halobacteriovorax sp. BALOs_7]|nr:hypothetical protein BALOs_2097 [Halobacteriovorax sp. BALOs_7]